MPTPFPDRDGFNPILRALVDGFDAKYLPEEGIEGEEAGIKREYWKAGRHSLVRSLAASVLSGDWGLGDTQEDVAAYLGVDHSCLSDALRKGEMGADSINESRPPGWPSKKVFDAMNRAGFIAASKHIASLVDDRPKLDPRALNELSYELLCAIFEDFDAWTVAQCCNKQQKHIAASKLCRRVCGDAARDVVPSWYRKDEAARVSAEVERILAGDLDMFRLLVDLQNNWEDIFAVASDVTESGVRFSLSLFEQGI
jgi:hypothetical protein